MTSKEKRNVALGVGYIMPNILGFLAFTLVPLVFSLVMAFSSWDLTKHNMFKPEAEIEPVGFENYARLLSEDYFWQYLGNTLFLMMGIPAGIAGSLLLAILLSKDLKGGNRRVWAWLLAGTGLLAGVVMLVAVGAWALAFTMLVLGGGLMFLATGLRREGGAFVGRASGTGGAAADPAVVAPGRPALSAEAALRGRGGPSWVLIGLGVFLGAVMLALAGFELAALLVALAALGGGIWLERTGLLCRRRILAGSAAAGAVVLLAGIALLLEAGTLSTAMTVLLAGVACMMLVGGALGGSTVYRTLFYVPHFTSGVAVYILWKKLYNPHAGPINSFLDGPLQFLTKAVRALPAPVVSSGLWVCYALVVLVLWSGVKRMRLSWKDGELGWWAAIGPAAFLFAPAVFSPWLTPTRTACAALAVAAGILAAYGAASLRERDFPASPSAGFGTSLMFSLALMVAEFALLGLGAVLHHLPAWAAAEGGLQPPEWIADYSWAKPAIMIMGLWAAVGSNNMLLYLAGLSNVPVELYEAADIDGASRFQKFWHVTWPQLAPVTFFIVVMSMIAGLQGGFEMARTMTQGGPAGSTTTLSYFIYREGFETGRLGFSSAVAWTLFVMVFAVTMFNWRFGNRYVND
jgi:multiple sugar transport system permease protein